jgi:hypothetical protein
VEALTGEPDGRRAELSVREGERVPDGLPDGDFIAGSLAGGGIFVVHADPRILISGEIVAQAANGLLRPCVTLEMSGHALNHLGALLKIRAVNREVVYRITGYVPEVHGYIGEWPD